MVICRDFAQKLLTKSEHNDFTILTSTYKIQSLSHPSPLIKCSTFIIQRTAVLQPLTNPKAQACHHQAGMQEKLETGLFSNNSQATTGVLAISYSGILRVAFLQKELSQNNLFNFFPAFGPQFGYFGLISFSWHYDIPGYDF